MLLKHHDVSPRIDTTAWVAQNAVICGNVTVGPGCRVMFGAQVIAEGGSIIIGRECIIMENAVLRSSARHSLSIGNNCLIGPNAHVVGCTLEDEVFSLALRSSTQRTSARAARCRGAPQDSPRRWRNCTDRLDRGGKPSPGATAGRA